MRNPTQQFRDEIQTAGLTPPDVIKTDGKLHRFASNGKRNDDAGWYVLHLEAFPLDGLVTGEEDLPNHGALT